MAIDRIGSFSSQPQAVENKPQNTSERGNNSVQHLQSAATADTVTLTAQADQLKSISADISGQSMIDGARVENLKSAIDAGVYKINSLSVAEKFIQFENSFFEDSLGNRLASTLRP